MNLKEFLNELQLTHIGRGKSGGELRKSTHYPRDYSSKIPPGVGDMWKIDGKMMKSGEANKYVTDKLKAAKIPEEEIDKMDLEAKVDKAKKDGIVK